MGSTWRGDKTGIVNSWGTWVKVVVKPPALVDACMARRLRWALNEGYGKGCELVNGLKNERCLQEAYNMEPLFSCNSSHGEYRHYEMATTSDRGKYTVSYLPFIQASKSHKAALNPVPTQKVIESTITSFFSKVPRVPLPILTLAKPAL